MKEVLLINNRKYYTGIGSRIIPKYIEDFFIILGEWFAKKGYCLRSGHADGSDKAFELGCDKVHGKKEIYLPWKGFNDSISNLYLDNMEYKFEAEKIAKIYHPYWFNLKQGAKRLQSRNSFQVLGQDLNTPCDFIICYTKNGKGQGGTGQAIRIAKDKYVPVFDCGKYDNIQEIKINLKKFLIERGIINE